jgi:hypothetical protein
VPRVPGYFQSRLPALGIPSKSRCAGARVLGALVEKDITTPDYYPYISKRAHQRPQPEEQPRACYFAGVNP